MKLKTFFEDETENIVLINEQMKWKTFFEDEMENIVLINENQT